MHKLYLLGKFAYINFYFLSDCDAVKYTRHPSGIKAFGARLRQLRLARHLSQEELAWKCDLETSQISRIERGVINTSLSHIFVLAEALDVPVRDMFDFDQQ